MKTKKVMEKETKHKRIELPISLHKLQSKFLEIQILTTDNSHLNLSWICLLKFGTNTSCYLESQLLETIKEENSLNMIVDPGWLLATVVRAVQTQSKIMSESYFIQEQ